jgi:pheromone shutdown protein TraB
VVSCFKNINETFLREDFFKLTHFWCLKHHIFLSEDVEAEIPPRSGEKFHKERLTEENFRSLMKELKFFDPERTQVLVSGRERFIESMKSIAKSCKYSNAVEI